MEVTRSNFVTQLHNITTDLKKSCFVGFDAEFTALLSGDRFKYRLFDTCEERYDKLKTEVSKMIMTQIGLTMFHYDREHEFYTATCYTFHVCPQVFGDVDQSFMFQASTLHFLCNHKFNFNKFIYEGLPYLSKAEEAQIRQDLKDNVMFDKLVRSMEMKDEKLLQKYCSLVSKWLCCSDEETLYLDVESPVLRYVVHIEVRKRFPDVLTTDSLGNSNKVLVYRHKHAEGASGAPAATLAENLLDHLLGFSRVMSLLEECKKPVVGHNMFLDLVLLHNQFLGPLPDKYDKFKKNIHEIFPNIFDTKYISFEMSKWLSFDDVWKSNALQDLYEFFAEGKCLKLQNGVNLIKLTTPFHVTQSYHEAGWDSYCSAYCLLRMGQWAACENSGSYRHQHRHRLRPVGPAETLAALAPHANKVNVIRGAVPYMDLVQEDPPRHRPPLLHVAPRSTTSTLDLNQVACTLAAAGSVDVKACSACGAGEGSDARAALVAAGSQHTLEKILNRFRHSREYRVTVYSAHAHLRRRAAGLAAWGGAFIAVLFVLHKLK